MQTRILPPTEFFASAARGVDTKKLLDGECDTKQCCDNDVDDGCSSELENNVLTVSLIRSGVGSLAYHPQTLRYTYTSLTLKGKRLTGLGEIVRWRQLINIDLEQNFLTDISAFAELPYLVAINVSHNRITDCLQYRTPLFSEGEPHPDGESMLGSMLARANLAHNRIKVIGNIDHHPFLEELIVSHNQIEQLPSLQALRHLQILDLTCNQLTDLTGLMGLNVKELYLGNNQISDLNPLSSLQKLRILTLANNQVADLSPLQQLTNLQAVNLEQNNIPDILQVAYLQAATWLHTLTLAKNPCASKQHYRYRVIARILQLKTLDGIAVTAKDKVKANNLIGGDSSDVQTRISNYERILAEPPPDSYAPQFVDDEAS